MSTPISSNAQDNQAEGQRTQKTWTAVNQAGLVNTFGTSHSATAQHTAFSVWHSGQGQQKQGHVQDGLPIRKG